MRASNPSGNQSHEGQPLDLDFASLGVTPVALATDYLTGNLFIATVADSVDISFVRQRRMSEPMRPDTAASSGSIYVALSDGRYLRKVISGHLQMPTAVVTVPTLGRICYADSGLHAKIECADMDGTHREVTPLPFPNYKIF